MFKENLFEIKAFIDSIADLSEYQLKDKIVNNILSKKLERSYKTYAENLTSKINYILSRNNYKVIKAITKKKKEELEKLKEQEEQDNE